MTFIVTYRDKSGAKREMALEAASRAECVAACRSRGVSPIAIRESDGSDTLMRRLQSQTIGSRNNADPVRSANGSCQVGTGCLRRYAVPVVLAVLVVLVGAAGLWWWLHRTTQEDDRPITPHKHVAVKDVPPATMKRSTVPDRDVKLQPSAQHVPQFKGTSNDIIPTNGWWRGLKVVSDVVTTNDLTGTIFERWQTEDGRFHSNQRSLPPIFESGSDQILAMMLGSQEPGPLPPMPIGPQLDEDFRKSLSKPIIINDSDTLEVKTLKRIVMEAREEMKRLMDQGQTPSQILMEHERLAGENFKVRADAMKELTDIEKSGDYEGAVKYAQTVNGVLRKMGIEELPMPLDEEAKAAEKEARRTRNRNKAGASQ